MQETSAPASKQSRMEEMTRVLVADGFRQTREELCTFLSLHGVAAYAAKDGLEMLSMMDALKPDATVFMLELPRRDGISILETLSVRQMQKYPYLVACTMMGEEIRNLASSLGADVVFNRPVKPDAIIECLAAVTGKGPSMLALRHAKGRTEIVKKQLCEIGMPSNLKGFTYLALAISLVSVDENLLRQVTGYLYPHIAVEYGVSDHSVERAIRHAIETTWTHGRVEALHRIFGNSIDPQRGKPTNTECIAMLAGEIQKQIATEV